MGATSKLEVRADKAAASKKRCGTCIDRKISCDRQLPKCTSCIRSNRICQGYGLRLSWPRKNDRKRFVVSRADSHARSFYQYARRSTLHMINATSWDIEVHYYLSMRRSTIAPTPIYSLSWSLSGLLATEKDLFQFFQCKVSARLSTFSTQPLGQSLLRIVSSDNSASSAAAQRALMAVAALQRYGPGFRAEELKLSALRALASSAAKGLDAQSAIQHVAAVMALCMFETQQSSESSKQWPYYLRAARNIINSITAEQFCRVTDGPVMIEWVHYHEILAQFSLSHSRQFSGKIPSTKLLETVPEYVPNTWTSIDDETNIVRVQKPLQFEQLFKPLHLLSEVVAEVISSRDTTAHGKDKEHVVKMRHLKDKIENAAIPTWWVSGCQHHVQRAAAKAEIYRLSTLVYLNRATGQSLVPPFEVPALVDRGLDMIERIGTCERPLPVLILGCEARTDDERLRILNLLSESTAPDRQIHLIRVLIEALWTQDDLHAEKGLEADYVEKLSAVFSSFEILPYLA